MKNLVETVRLPSGDESIAPVTILDAQGHVMRVVAAADFRRTPPARQIQAPGGDSPLTKRKGR